MLRDERGTPTGVQASFGSLRTVLADARAQAPDELRADLALVADGIAELDAALAAVGYSYDALAASPAALEVSAALARRDASRAADAVARSAAIGPGTATAARWRRAFASTAHVVTRRPIFPPRSYARYQVALGVLRSCANRRAAGEAPQPTIRRA